MNYYLLQIPSEKKNSAQNFEVAEMQPVRPPLSDQGTGTVSILGVLLILGEEIPVTDQVGDLRPEVVWGLQAEAESAKKPFPVHTPVFLPGGAVPL